MKEEQKIKMIQNAVNKAAIALVKYLIGAMNVDEKYVQEINKIKVKTYKGKDEYAKYSYGEDVVYLNLSYLSKFESLDPIEIKEIEGEITLSIIHEKIHSCRAVDVGDYPYVLNNFIDDDGNMKIEGILSYEYDRIMDKEDNHKNKNRLAFKGGKLVVCDVYSGKIEYDSDETTPPAVAKKEIKDKLKTVYNVLDKQNILEEAITEALAFLIYLKTEKYNDKTNEEILNIMIKKNLSIFVTAGALIIKQFTDENIKTFFETRKNNSFDNIYIQIFGKEISDKIMELVYKIYSQKDEESLIELAELTKQIDNQQIVSKK